MIFSKDLIGKVLAGAKTQTRRIAHPCTAPHPATGGWDCPQCHGTHHLNSVLFPPCRYRLGHSYAVQGHRGGKTIDRILITALRLQHLSDLTFDDARAEGFKTRDDFHAYWTATLHRPANPATPVWAITFHLDRTEEIRLLHRDPAKGYTPNRGEATLPLDTRPGAWRPDDEPEAISEPLTETYATTARVERAAEAQRRITTNQPLHDELRTTLQTASDLGVDVRNDARAIKRRVTDMQRKIGKRVA